ncbi:YncE family protein [Paenibacillus roseipurpureus]|uniref:YncE family protein n=1 Tax=Paenibacillus roseopurpureus TaxID=2918901 RepID=A0AA96RJ08_9BACL|nr:YncE family protein [Paenibacillus sp. MBLB1832]WNR42666.1 YncE family protein [Paenibacillus sp. MBLB1832]
MIRNEQPVQQASVSVALPRLLVTIPTSRPVNEFAFNPITNRCYFLLDDDRLGVMNTKTNKILTTLRVGQLAQYLVVNPRTNRVYVSNFYDGTVSVIHGITNKVITTIPVGERCDEIAVNPCTNFIYVSTISLSSKNGSLVVLNGKTNTIERRIAFKGRPSNIVVNEAANRIYVTNTSTDSVSILNGLHHKILKTVKVGRNPVITPVLTKKRSQLVVANNLSRYCSVVNLRTAKVSKIGLGRRQSGITYNPNTNRIFITSAQVTGKGKLFVINGCTKRIVKTLTVPTFSNTLIDPASNYLYVSHSPEEGKASVTIYHGGSLKQLTKLQLGASIRTMAIHPKTNRLYVGGDNRIMVIS